jgi:hypothetical protein
MSTKWRIYCADESEEGWKYIWSDTTPTECPNSSTHQIRGVNSVGIEIPVVRVIPSITSTNSSNYTRIATINYNEDTMGSLRRVKVLSYNDSGATEHSVEVFDATSNISLISANLTSTIDFAVNDVGVFSGTGIDPGENLLEIYLKKTGGNNSQKAYISQIILYAES